MLELDSATAATWVITAVVQGALVIVLCGRIRALIPAIHALMFVVFVPVLGATNAILSGVPGCDVVGLVSSSIGATLYVVLFLGIASRFPGALSMESWLPGIRSSTGYWIVGCVAWWFVVKTYLFATYGVSAIRALGLFGPDAALTTYAYWETIVNAGATTLLQAAIFVWVLRLALRLDSIRVSSIVVLALFAELLLGDLDAGARRTILALALAYFLARWWVSAGDGTRLLKQSAFAVAVIAAFSIYYPFVRANIFKPDIHTQLTSGSSSETLSGALALLTPDSESAQRGRTILRGGPMEFLCTLSEKQWERKQLTWGSVTSAALYMSVPSAILLNKTTTEPDEVIAESYDLFPATEFLVLDLATSPLAQLQSDFGPAGWILAPIVYAVASLILAYVFVSPNFGMLTRLLALGTLWSVVASPEATLTTPVTGLRDFLLFSVPIELLRHLHAILRRGVVVQTA
jgi:hypothetical protein